MTLETRKVLDLLAEGKIGAADAEKLLEKLQGATTEDEEPLPAAPNAGKKHYLRIVVDEPGRKQVNIRMPLGFFRSGGLSILGMLPAHVAEKLKERGLDIGAFRLHKGKDEGELMEALNNLDLDVDKGDGKKVRIFCE
jgi:hypothetical protein